MRQMIRVGLLASVCFTPLAWGGDPLDEWTVSDTSNLTGGLRAITFVNGQFVAVGDGGTIATSLDGDKWTQRQSGTTLNLRAICFADSQYVAAAGSSVGPDGTSGIFTSPDGYNWTERYSGIGFFNAVAHGKGRWVAVGGPDAVRAPVLVWSDDGIDWNLAKGPPVTSADAPALYGLAYGNDVFVAVYPGWDFSVPRAAAYVSSDGREWTRWGGAQGLQAILFENGQFVAVGGYVWNHGGSLLHHSVMCTSTNGTNWITQLDSSNPGGVMRALAYGGGQFLAAGDYGAWSSPDGAKWTWHYTGPTAIGAAYGNGRFVLAFGGIMRSGVIGPRLGASISPEGQFVGRVSGADGQQVAIQTSTNLGSWSSLTNVVITNGVGTFADPIETNNTQRFYKASEIQH